MDETKELDATVAMNVMGWLPHIRNTAHWTDAESVNATDYRVRGIVDEWSPSTDIKDAWEVVERMMQLGRAVDIARNGTINEPLDDWEVCFPRGEHPALTMASAVTAPLAICLAALKCVQYIESSPSPAP